MALVVAQSVYLTFLSNVEQNHVLLVPIFRLSNWEFWIFLRKIPQLAALFCVWNGAAAYCDQIGRLSDSAAGTIRPGEPVERVVPATRSVPLGFASNCPLPMAGQLEGLMSIGSTPYGESKRYVHLTPLRRGNQMKNRTQFHFLFVRFPLHMGGRTNEHFVLFRCPLRSGGSETMH